MTYGVSLLEVMIVIAIIGLMVSIMLPAIQSARESARATICSSNLRQVSFSSLAQSELSNHLPESRILFSDDGTPVEERLWGKFHAREWHGAMDPQNPFALPPYLTRNTSPAVSTCPSAPESEELRGLPTRLADLNSTEGSVGSCDYRGNWGVRDPAFSEIHRGAYSIMRNQSPSRRLSTIEDGFSQTLFAWETIGAKSASVDPFRNRIVLRAWDQSFVNFNTIQFDDAARSHFGMRTGRSLLGYYTGWSGFVIGEINVLTLPSAQPGGKWDRRYLVNNHHGDPFSLHPAGINVSFCDGRVQGLSHAIDLQPLTLLAGCDNGIVEDP